jgi:hypothetical protein
VSIVRRQPSDIGPFPEADRVAPAASSPEYELHAIELSLDDLAPEEKAAPRPGGVWRPLFWVALALAASLALVGWLLVGPPLGG